MASARSRLPGLAALLVLGALGCSGQPTPAPSASTTASSVAPAPTVSARPESGVVLLVARTFALSAGSGHVSGSIERAGDSLMVDVEGIASGTNQRLFLTRDGAGTAEVLTIGNDYWLGGDEAFWTEQTGSAEAAADAVGKYVAISASDATELGEYTLRRVIGDVFGRDEVTALQEETTPVTEAEVDGRAVWRLGEESGARLWVASDGSGELLRVAVAGQDPLDLTFERWERAETFVPPAAEDLLEQ